MHSLILRMLEVGGWLEFQPHHEISGHGLKQPETRHFGK
jgi:hypothetical protein